MARRTHYSKPTLAAAAAGREVPTWPVTWAYLLACGVPQDEEDAWRRDHAEAAREHKAWSRRAPGDQSDRSTAGTPPRPQDVRTPEDLARALDALRRGSGLSFRDMERRARSCVPPRALPIQTAHDAIRAGRPSEHTLEAILAVCDVTEPARRLWLAAWRRTVLQTDRDRAVVRVMRMLAPSPQSAELDEALKAVGSLAAAVEPQPPEPNASGRELYVEAAKLLDYPDNLGIRLNGIHSLERIAIDSPGDQHTVVEMLSAFVRTRSTDPMLRAPTHADPTEPALVRQAADIRTAVQVLARLPRLPGIPRADLTGADLTGAASLAHLDLTNADLRAVPLSQVDLMDARLDGANLSESRLDGANLDSAWLDGANLAEARLRGANLTRARLSWANLAGAILREANLTNAGLRGAALTSARLGKANLTGAWLDGANLRAAWLNGANLRGAWLNGAHLTDARLRGANLTDARLREANLTDARLEEADLSNAFLVGSRLDRTNLTGARLDGANLTGTYGLTQAQVDSAIGNAATQLPVGIARPAW